MSSNDWAKKQGENVDLESWFRDKLIIVQNDSKK